MRASKCNFPPTYGSMSCFGCQVRFTALVRADGGQLGSKLHPACLRRQLRAPTMTVQDSIELTLTLFHIEWTAACTGTQYSPAAGQEDLEPVRNTLHKLLLSKRCASGPHGVHTVRCYV